MGIVSVLLLVLFSVTSVLLILIIMLQDEQGEGLGGIFGGGGASGQIGNRKGNILTKTTTVLGVVFVLTSFGLAWLNRTPDLGNPGAIQADSTEEFEAWWNQLPEADDSSTESGN